MKSAYIRTYVEIFRATKNPHWAGFLFVATSLIATIFYLAPHIKRRSELDNVAQHLTFELAGVLPGIGFGQERTDAQIQFRAKLPVERMSRP